MSQSNQSKVSINFQEFFHRNQVFIECQKFLLKRYLKEKGSIIFEASEIEEQLSNYVDELESHKETDVNERDEEWTDEYNLIKECMKELRRELEELEVRWKVNQNKKPNMV